MTLDSLELQQRPILTTVGDVLTTVEMALKMVFGCQKMFSSFATIFSRAETEVEVPATIFPAIETMVWTIQTMFFLVQTTVGVTQTLFSEAETIIDAPETWFSITEKTVGRRGNSK